MNATPGTSRQIIWYRERYEVLRHAAAIASVDGLIIEFGVASGGTINFLADYPALRGRRIFGFDSFHGLPEQWGPYQAGYFACDIPEVPVNVSLIVGTFEQTLAPFLFKNPENVALLHIDCDLYSSTKTVLHHLSPRIVPGTVILMDEYWIEVDQEQRAFNEWLEVTGRRVKHEARADEQLCVTVIE